MANREGGFYFSEEIGFEPKLTKKKQQSNKKATDTNKGGDSNGSKKGDKKQK